MGCKACNGCLVAGGTAKHSRGVCAEQLKPVFAPKLEPLKPKSDIWRSRGVPLAREDACRNCQAGPLVWFAGTPDQALFAVGRITSSVPPAISGALGDVWRLSVFRLYFACRLGHSYRSQDDGP